jgi:hypothetical protein
MPTPPKPEALCGDLEHLPAALLPLIKETRWVVWNWELRTNKDGSQSWTKPLWQIRNPSWHAKTNDPKTWGPFDAALKLVLARRMQGVGFTLLKSNIAAVDIDHVRDPKTGLTVPWAEQLIEEAKAISCYVEVTPSGTGYRIIGRATGNTLNRRFNVDANNGTAVELFRSCERYITVTGLEVGQCNELPLIDAFIDALLARYENGGGGGAAAGLFDFNDAARQGQSLDYEDLIKNGAPAGSDRSDLFHSVIGHLYGQGLSEDEIIERLACHPKGIAAKYSGRLGKEVRRSYRKWQGKKQTGATGQLPPLPSGGGGGGGGGGGVGGGGGGGGGGGTAQPGAAPSQPQPQSGIWPSIRILAGELPRVVDEAEQALLASGHELYQRGGLIVRPTLSTLKAARNRDTLAWRLIQLNAQHLIELMTRAARFYRYNERKKRFLVTDAPLKIAETYLAREGLWRVPILTGIVNTPFLRIDGTLCDQPGYDAATGLVFKPNGVSFPRILPRPNRDDALKALAVLNKPIETFPFVTSADRSVALSGILTPLDRHALATAPLHAFDSPVAGSGKSLLVDLIAMIAIGRLMPVISQGRNEEEFEKRLGAALLAGDVVVSIDNIDRELQSAFLCQALTQQMLNIRLLGYSRNIETPVLASVYATGNNLTVAGDLTRRTLMSTLDAGIERPETRTFDVDVLSSARAERPRLVAAGLTILRAWHNTEQKEEGAKLDPFGGFDSWSQRIRQALVWLDQTDPCETVVKVRKGDPERLELYAVMEQWRLKLGIGGSFPIPRVIEHADVDCDFHAALMAIASGQAGISSLRLSRWLRRNERKVIGGFRFQQTGMLHGYPLWSLVKA